MNAYKKEKKQGWLRRKGGRINIWSRRWCILSDNFFFFYNKEDDKKHQDCITLDGQTIIEISGDLNSNEPKRYQFDIIGGLDKNQTEVISLCADTEEQRKEWTRALKKALYASKGGALFSQSLDEILNYERRENRIIPYIVDECVEFLYKYGLEAEGIFRLPGRQSAIKDIITRFEKGEKIKFEEENVDVHVVASVLKTFLRDLPDSIIPCRFFQKFMNIALRFMEASDADIRNSCVLELTEGMKNIPKDNYVILKYVCRFLREVGLRESMNKMSMMSLGTVFGYNIIRHIDKENSHLLMCTADLGQNLVFMLLEYFPTIFKLEYSDKGEVGNVVPTEDLLRMSRNIDVLPLNPDALLPSYLKELEGVEFNSPSPLTPDSCTSSLGSLNIHDSASNPSENYFFNSSDLDEKRRSLHLSFSDSSEAGKSQTSPVSPEGERRDHPVPPKRKSRIQRNRFASEKVKPNASYHVENDKPKLPDIKNILPVHNSSNNPEDIPQSISKSNEDVSQSNSKIAIAVVNKAFSHDETSGDGKIAPSYSNLQSQVTALKEELALQKEKSKRQVNALKQQLNIMREKYEIRIQAIESEFFSHKLDLEKNMAAEKRSCADVITENVQLKERLLKYEFKFGVL